MRLYHPQHFNLERVWISLILVAILVGCAAPQATQASIAVTIFADQGEHVVNLPAGSTVQQALDTAGLSAEALDKVDPPLYTILTDGSSIKLVRITEKFEIEQNVLPFERQVLRNESLPLDQEILLQKGKNGLKEITYRRVFEDHVEVSNQRVPVKSIIIEEPVPEIVMIGIQTPFFPIQIPGRLFYLRDGNLWMIEKSTASRRAVITTGDLDGRILKISDDGSWLLFSRQTSEEGQINRLWAVNLTDGLQDTTSGSIGEERMVDLEIDNVIHFADWMPGSNSKLIFSTVEPSSTAPGWQANNDLHTLTFSQSGWKTQWTTILEPNTGGIYGWWGTNYLWDPAENWLAYTRPDSVGIVDIKNRVQKPIMSIVPYQTQGDWAWAPGITWGPDSRTLYTVNHIAPPDSSSFEQSQVFDLGAIITATEQSVNLSSQTGMFSYPTASPSQQYENGEIGYQIAYLQAIFPTQSETSRYRLAVIDRDGSNQRLLFPPEEKPGLEPLQYWGAWSPSKLPDSGNFAIVIIYEGNLWLVDVTSGEAQQITSDGLTTRVLWE